MDKPVDLDSIKILHGDDLKIYTLREFCDKISQDDKNGTDHSGTVLTWFLSRILRRIGIMETDHLDEKSLVRMVNFLIQVGAETDLI